MSLNIQSNRVYVQIALSLDVAPVDKVFLGTKLSHASLEENETVDLEDAVAFIQNVNRHGYSPIWPAILGKHLGVTAHGPVGYATISAPTMGKALMTFLEWFQVRSGSYLGQINESDEAFEIEIFDATGNEDFKKFFFECYMRAFEVLMELIVGQVPKGKTALHFEVDGAGREELMREEYASELSFSQPQNKLVVPKDLWYVPSPLYDRDSHEFNLRKCQQLLEQSLSEVRTDMQVKQLLRRTIEQRIIGDALDEAWPTIKTLCGELHMSERTLIRRLEELRTSYKTLQEQERRFYADKLLKEARYTIFQIAEILGYRESANFCRAFKTWFGQSPTAYRRNPLP